MADDCGDFKIAHVAGLARLELTPDEQLLYQKQLGEILAFADRVRAVQTDGVAPMRQALALPGTARRDEPAPSLSAEEALGNAPDAQPSPALFRVPRILG
jgi:aspartyl-tRNA(Asn)/glutamyl-tRNA(Gln) amidotransferase subunit C